jgi:uncharacterized protein YjbJ (UPF0337 family)
MGWLDKLMGRSKQTVGTATDSPAMREEGRHQEAAGEAEARASAAEDRAQAERERAAKESAEADRLNP